MQDHLHWRNDLSLILAKAGVPVTSPALVARVMRQLSGPSLLKIDPICRHWGDWRRSVRAPDRKSFSLPHGESSDGIAAYLFLAGCNPNGFTRQQAILTTSQYPSSLAIALLLIRCADWVIPVRRAAEDVLQSALKRDPVLLFEHIELISRLLKHERFANSAWPDIVSPVLLDPRHEDLRWSSFEAGGGRHRMQVIDLILRADPQRAHALRLRALGVRDPVIARWALRTLTHKHDPASNDDETDKVISLGMQHPNAGVRVEALRLRVARGSAGLSDDLREQLLSPLHSMRNLAAFHSPQHGIDVMHVWRDAVDDPRCAGARNALASLCERASAEDFDRLVPWASHEVSEARRHALMGLAKVDVERATPWLRRALASWSIKEVRTALACGRHASSFLTRETLVEAYEASPAPSCRQLILHAMRTLWPWNHLEALLDCAETPHGSQDSAIVESLRHWQGARIGKLDPQLHSVLQERVEHIAPQMPEVDWNRIRRILDAG